MIATASWTRHPVGSRAEGLETGDLLLVHSHGQIAPRLIGLGQRFHHEPRFAYWTHAAVVWTPDTLIEAKGHHRVRELPLAQYDDRDYAAIRFSDSTVDPAMRANAAEFLTGQLGKRYGYSAVAWIGLWSLFGGTRFVFGGKGWFCSDLAAAASTYLGAIYTANALTIMPADLARVFGVSR